MSAMWRIYVQVKASVQKVYGIKDAYFPKLLELASVGCWVMVMGIVSNCINFTIFAFVMVSNAQKRCAIFGCYVDSSV